MADNIKQIREEIQAIGQQKMALREVEETWKNLNKEVKENKGLVGAAKKAIQDKLKALEHEFGTQKDLKKLQKEINTEQSEYIKLLNKAVAQREKLIELGQDDKGVNEEINNQLQEQLKRKTNIAKRTEELLKPNEELLDLQNSIANTLGTASAEYDIIKKKILGQNNNLKSIVERIEDLGDGSERNKELALEAAEAYKEQHTNAATLKKELDRGAINQAQFNKAILRMSGYWDDVISKIDTSTEKGKELHDYLKSIKEESVADSKAQMKSPGKSAIGAGAGAFTSRLAGESGAPLLGEIGDVGKSAINFKSVAKANKNSGKGMMDNVEGAAATGNLYVAIGTAAAAAIGVFTKLTPYFSTFLEVEKQILQTTADLNISLNNMALSVGAFGGRNFVKELANVNFQTEMLKNGYQFAADAATAFFGTSLTGIKSYSGAQMQLAGISAQTIGSASSIYASLSGIGDNNVIAGLTIAAKRLGLSDDAMSNMVSSAKLLDNATSDTAANLVNATQKFAMVMKLNVGAFMKNYAEAAGKALSYGIGNTKELREQVAYVTKLGLNFNQIAESQKNAVLNYQDQIDSERTLEAYLGQRIDLSGYRQLISQGKRADALKELKNNPQLQALNPLMNKDLSNNIFARSEIEKTFGMTFDDYSKIFKNGFTDEVSTPKSGIGKTLKDTNNQYLSAFQNAMNNLQVKTAIMEVGQAVITTQIEADKKLNELQNETNVATNMRTAARMNYLQIAQADAFRKDVFSTQEDMLKYQDAANKKFNQGLQKSPYKMGAPSPYLQPNTLSQILSTGQQQYEKSLDVNGYPLESGKKIVDTSKGLDINITVNTAEIAGKVVDFIAKPTNQLANRKYTDSLQTQNRINSGDVYSAIK